MYIKRLAYWKKKDWERFFSHYYLSREEENEVRLILIKDKRGIESFFPYLKHKEIINGVGPETIIGVIRHILTYLFAVVRYEWHDIEYSIGGDENDRLRADKGLLEYSLLSIEQDRDILFGLNLDPLQSLLQKIIFYIMLPINYSIIYFCYAMVRIGGKKSFRYQKVYS